MEILSRIKSLNQAISNLVSIQVVGMVTAVKGIVIEVKGLSDFVTIGTKCTISKSSLQTSSVLAEVVALKDEYVILLPYGDTEGIGLGGKVVVTNAENAIWPDESWRGRVLNAFANPIDDKGLLAYGDRPYFLNSAPLNPQKRRRLGPKIDLGVKALDCFTSCCQGQRMGIFAGSGVGKSVLISMLTKYSKTDIKVIGLIGERGREVQEFIQEYLGEEGLKNAIVIVATSDEPALMRKRAAYLTMTIAEYFRDQGVEVLCIMDSITRLAMAQRDIGLAAGELPANKGYTPSVFSEMPKLLERAGPGIDKGDITGIFTVLVEGDDQSEPISDCVRSIIDGHIVLDRGIFERGRYPAVDVLRSVSRALPKCNNKMENKILQEARRILATYNDMADMIRIGAYKAGTDKEIDNSMKYFPLIEDFLRQNPEEYQDMNESFRKLGQILGIESEIN
ncbi:MAG: flagellar protein export ATPase FliI [Alphaproteobacteria bacterium]|nr:flagellar protein export ATPase FliI [Alphaproteobacteria bacterium]